MVPMQVRRFRLNRAPRAEASWLLEVLDCESRKLGTRVQRQDDDTFHVIWGLPP
jgi:poly-gamma-glutamate synthesis protein (capsule biosynthesis protein)